MKVEAGQPLVELDPNDAQVAYDQAVANLAGTVRQVRGLYSSVDAGQADIKARKIAVAQARADVERREGLVASGAVSREELRSEEHTSELQSLMRISYAVFCLKKKTQDKNHIAKHDNKNDTHTHENKQETKKASI